MLLLLLASLGTAEVVNEQIMAMFERAGSACGGVRRRLNVLLESGVKLSGALGRAGA